MDHERAFLQAIREEPEDDARRLIFADWLDEQGGAAREARASFIRAQCRLASLPADDPHRDLLEDEADDLLALHEKEWTRALHGIAREWRFARGFVEHISIRGEDFLRHAETRFDAMPLRSVHLLIAPRDIPQLAACPALRWVEALDFHRCHLNDRALQNLLTSPHLTRLKSLDLTGNVISTPGIQTLLQSAVGARLRRLDLSHNRGIGDRAVRLLAQAPAEKLEELSLDGTIVTSAGLQTLFQSPHLTHLASLNISGTCFEHPKAPSALAMLAESGLLRQLRILEMGHLTNSRGLAELLRSPAAANLRALHLSHIIDQGNKDIALLAEARHLTNLTVLDLRYNNLGPEVAQALSNCPHLASLTELNIGFNRIRDAGAKAFAESPYLTRLSELNLAQNEIGGPGVKALTTSSYLGRLRSLNLADNFIGEEAVGLLASSPNLTRLRKLSLPMNQLGDAGVKVLAQSSHLARLTSLDLSCNRIGKAGAEILAATSPWQHLRNLDLRGNDLTDTEETLLRERFGDAVMLS